MVETKNTVYIVAVMLLLAVTLTFRPGLWLMHKAANTQSVRYEKGWEDGCLSGTNSYSLVFAPLMDRPFIKELEEATPEGEKVAAPDKAHYKTGWNEGFTLCRYYQSAVYELMQFAVVIATLLYIGYLIARKKP